MRLFFYLTIMKHFFFNISLGYFMLFLYGYPTE